MEKKIEKINSNLAIYIILSLISIFYLSSELISGNFSNSEVAIIVVLLFAFLVFSYFISLKIFDKKLKIETYFLLFSILFGMFYIFGFPPSQLPDDESDYLRTLEVSKFELTTPQKGEKVGRYLSTNIRKVYSAKSYSDVLKNKDLKFNKEKKFYNYANKSLYSFICYIPQAIGVFIANLFGAPILIQIIFGKLFNYIFYVILIYFAIKYIPVKKELLFFISLLPISLQEATSLSPDAMIISTIVALLSFVLYQRQSKKTEMSTKNKILLGILAVVISLCKIVYLPLIFLIFLIPDNKFRTKKEKFIYCGIICLISVFLNLYWLSISSRYLAAFHSRSNSSLQLSYILHHPISYCIILFRTVSLFIIDYLQQMVGSSLGSFIVPTSPIMVLVSIILLYKLICKTSIGEKKLFKNFENLYIAILLIGTVLLLFTSLYMQWTGYRNNVIEGVQGRYFIPLIPIVSMLFMKEKEITYNKKLMYIVFFIGIMSIIAIYKTFI